MIEPKQKKSTHVSDHPARGLIFLLVSISNLLHASCSRHNNLADCGVSEDYIPELG